MTAGEWIALGVGGLTIIGGGGVWLGGLTYRAGRHTEQVTQLRKELDQVKETQTEHAKAISTWDQALKLLEEVRKDVKGLLTTRARRVSEAGD